MNTSYILKTSIFAVALASLAVGCATNAAAQPKTNYDLIERYFEIVDSKQVEELSAIENSGLEYMLPLGKMDAATHGQVLASFAVAFPNYKHTIARCVEVDDLISCEGTFSGDHTGPLAMPDGSSLPATQKHVEFPIAVFARIEDGKFSEYNGYFDVLGFLVQLGVGPGAAGE